jgi:5'-nucleotidase/UDP-sugar diphosphatase
MNKFLKYLLLLTILLGGCKKDDTVDEGTFTTLTIFSINDPHAQIDNFSKIKHIVDVAETEGNVLVVSGGDIFSGNPVVDFVSEKGYPMIDLMNRSGFDVSVIGNHEFDYGQSVLTERIEQAEFDFICANVDMTGSIVPQPEPYVTLSVGDLDITFLGMIQTSYTSGEYIPATHPLKIEGISFEPATDIIDNYASLKEDTGADIVILLSHLGTNGDYNMAENFPYMDVIIGGHSHAVIDQTINNIHIYQSGGYLNYLGKISLEISNKEIIKEEFELIDLDSYPDHDTELAASIDEYNDVPELKEVIGYNAYYINKYTGLGCFYTDALRSALGTDVSFQNGGGIRNDLDQGDITVQEIYEIDPFNNGAHTYSMTVGSIKTFFEETGTSLHYSGVIFENDGNRGVIVKEPDGTELNDDIVLTVGVNDYIPAVYSAYFTTDPIIDDNTTAELIIDYLRLNSNVNYSSCNRYFTPLK